MNKTSDDNQEIDLLKELVKWAKLNVSLSHKPKILEILGTPKHKLVFQMSDGKTSRELAKEFHMSSNTVTKWWKIWIAKGIAQSVPVKGGGIRAQRSFSLEEFGIEIPSLEEAIAQKVTEEE